MRVVLFALQLLCGYLKLRQLLDDYCRRQLLYDYSLETTSVRLFTADNFCTIVHSDNFCADYSLRQASPVIHLDNFCAIVHLDNFCTIDFTRTTSGRLFNLEPLLYDYSLRQLLYDYSLRQLLYDYSLRQLLYDYSLRQLLYAIIPLRQLLARLTHLEQLLARLIQLRAASVPIITLRQLLYSYSLGTTSVRVVYSECFYIHLDDQITS